MVTRFKLALVWAIALTAVAQAGELNPKQVPADAKWLAHVDLAALEETKALQKVRDTWPQKTERFRTWMQETYGVDPREDFESVTLYGTSYGKDDCVMILTSDYSTEKVKSRIESQQDVQKTEWCDHTLYTCPIGKAGKDKSYAQDQQQTQQAHSSSSGKSTDRVSWALIDDNTIAYSKSVRGLKDAIETIEGHNESLAGKDSKLTADLPNGAVAYAAATSLDSISHEGMLFPILRQHEHACFVLGERDGKLFDELKLVARNEEVAKQMKQVIEGYTAALKVSCMDSEPMSKMMDNVEIKQDGSTVTANWSGEIERFTQALNNLKSQQRR